MVIHPRQPLRLEIRLQKLRMRHQRYRLRLRQRQHTLAQVYSRYRPAGTDPPSQIWQKYPRARAQIQNTVALLHTPQREKAVNGLRFRESVATVPFGCHDVEKMQFVVRHNLLTTTTAQKVLAVSEKIIIFAKLFFPSKRILQ